MRIIIGRFEFEGSVGLRGWSVFLRLPGVCEAYTYRDAGGPAFVDTWKDRDGSRTIRMGRAELTISPQASVRWVAAKRQAEVEWKQLAGTAA